MCVHYQWTEICEIQNKKNLTENKNDNFFIKLISETN